MKKMLKLAVVILILLSVIFTLHWHVVLIDDLPVGKLPGDFSFYIEKTRIFVPITTSILTSIVLLFIWEKIIKRGR